ncbi:MAG: hypothetical protein H8E91_02530 [Planctomycetes bacterium]|nr:hypothetical protein [Planctomycetota bacterium]
MSENEKSSCCPAGKFPFKCLYAVLHILILTCMATSLWQIAGALADK